MLSSRPPPLQLRLDNMLPNLGIRPPKSLYTKLYETSWRPAVVALAIINALRFALQANNAFHDVDIDEAQHFPGLARISFTLGVMYLATSSHPNIYRACFLSCLARYCSWDDQRRLLLFIGRRSHCRMYIAVENRKDEYEVVIQVGGLATRFSYTWETGCIPMSLNVQF